MDIRYNNFKKVNFLNKNYILLILLITTLFSLIVVTYKNYHLKKLEEKELNTQSDKIKNCIDIENKIVVNNINKI